MKSVKVFLSNGTNYETSVSDASTAESLRDYFVNKSFVQQDEKTMLECIGIEFEGQTIKGMKMLEADLRIKLMTTGIKQNDIFDTKELQAKYKVLGFEAPFVVVEDRTTGRRGSLQFTHMPRLYWGFTAEF